MKTFKKIRNDLLAEIKSKGIIIDRRNKTVKQQIFAMQSALSKAKAREKGDNDYGTH